MSGSNPLGKGSSAPAAPDFAAAARAQAESGHVNQTNPFGSTGWTQGPDGRWTQSTQLAPGIQGGIAGLENQIGSQGPLGTGDQAREAGVAASYGQAASRLDPRFAEQEESLKAQLAGQGLDPGSQAYDNAMRDFNLGKNDAYSSAERNAQITGSQIGATTFGENLASQQLPYQQLAELNGLQSGLTGNGMQTQLLPAASAAYQGALQNYGIQQQGKNSFMGGAAGLGAAALMA